MAEFEFDREKSAANLDKHGIDFVRAQEIWDDPNSIEIGARSVEEIRFAIIGRVGDDLWTAIVTDRNAAIRIISVRRARHDEMELYDVEKGKRDLR